MQNVLVVGATGEQGKAQVRELLSANYRVKIMSRQPSPSQFPGTVETVCGDLLIPSSLTNALEGVDTVFLNLPSASFISPDVVLEGFANFLSAAEQIHPDRVVFNASLYVSDQLEGHVAHDTRYRIIQALQSSSIRTTTVCPVIFMENLLQPWALPDLLLRNVLNYPHATQLPVSWISLVDVAKIMVALAKDERAVGKKYIIGGPQALCGAETAAALGRAWGREIRFESRPLENFTRQMGDLFGGNDALMSQRIEHDLMQVYRWYNERSPSPFTVDLSDLLEHYFAPMTTVQQWATSRNPFPVQ
jgi:uncharacterized protein YbjT (DUF2867 family)